MEDVDNFAGRPDSMTHCAITRLETIEISSAHSNHVSVSTRAEFQYEFLLLPGTSTGTDLLVANSYYRSSYRIPGIRLTLSA